MSEDREWKRGARVARDSRTQLNSELARLSRAHLSLSLTEVRVEVCGGEVVSATARGAGVRTCHSATSSLADHAWAEIEDRSVERTRREEQISFSEWVLSQNVNPGMEVISPTMMRRYAHISVQKNWRALVPPTPSYSGRKTHHSRGSSPRPTTREHAFPREPRTLLCKRIHSKVLKDGRHRRRMVLMIRVGP